MNPDDAEDRFKKVERAITNVIELMRHQTRLIDEERRAIEADREAELRRQAYLDSRAARDYSPDPVDDRLRLNIQTLPPGTVIVDPSWMAHFNPPEVVTKEEPSVPSPPGKNSRFRIEE